MWMLSGPSFYRSIVTTSSISVLQVTTHTTATAGEHQQGQRMVVPIFLS